MADTTNPYLQILEQEEARRRTQSTATLTQALPVKPDTYAAQRRDAMTLGAPVAAVEALPDEMAQRAQQLRIERDIAGSATLQRRFTDADFARLAHDDTPALSNVGKAVAAMTRYAMGADNGGLQQDLRAGVYAASRGAAGVFRGTLETFLAPWLDFTEGRVPGGNPLRRLAEGFGDLAEQAGAEQKRLSPPQEGLIRGGVSSGVQSLAQNALMLPGALLGGPAGAVAALAGMAGFAGGQSYQEGREQGLTPASAAVLGTSQGLIEFATEKIPMSRLLGDLSAASPLYKTLMRQMAAEIPGEQLATVLQDLNEWAALPRNKDKPFSEYLAERPSAAAQTLIATVIGVGGNVAITSAISKVAELQLDQAAQAEQAQRHAALVGELMKAAGGAQLAQRAPASLRDLVQEMAAESDAPGEVFIDARTLVGEDGQGGLLNQDQIAELLPSVAPQLQEAVLTGGDVSVPIGELVGLAGTPLEQGVLEHLRVDPAGISVAEATAASAAATEWLQSAAGKALDAAADRNEAQASAERVQAVIRQQLDAVGRFTSEVHEAYSALVRDFYTTLAGDLGMTAEQAYQAYPLRIGGVNPAAAGLMQPAFHGTHARGIDKFDVSKVGTGEGTQAFGHGLYFAGRRAVAEHYRKLTSKSRGTVTLAGKNVAGMFPTYGPEDTALSHYAFNGGDLAATEKALLERGHEAALRWLQANAADLAISQGQTYAVEVPEDDVLLDREARVGDQPESVRKALESLGIRMSDFDVVDPSGKVLTTQESREQARAYIARFNAAGRIREKPTTITGERAYNLLSKKLGGDAAASEALRKAGVPGLSYFDQFSRQPNTPAAERTRNYVIFSGDDVEITGAFYQSRVKEATPAVTRLLKSLTPAEQAKVTDKVAAKIIELMKDLPSAKETAAVAYAGRAKRGWYAQSADALLQVFGHDAPRFAALLAAMSPQTGVEANLTNALRTWREWTAAGRPKGRDKIVEIMGRSVQGNKGTDSVLGAWINNSVRALEAEDFSKLTLSGPKVNSFFRNLVGVTDEVTNDAWMANFALVDQTMFSGSINADNTDPGKRPGYMAMSALVRQAAAHLTKLTGETWTPAEVQETVWSWAKTLYELSAQAGESRSARELIEQGALTDDLIASTPDFGSLFHNPAYANILKESGYGDRLEQLAAQRAAAGQSVQEPGAGGQAAPFAPEAQRRYELAAARRLEQLLESRGDARAASREAAAERQFERDIAELQDEGGYQQSAPGGQPAAGGAVLEPAGVRGGDGALAEPRGPGARADKPLAGLPATVKVDGRDVTFGPHAPARRAAERYMERAGLPYQPPSTYAKVDKARAARIAQAFEEMPHAPNDPRVKAAYDALIRETVAQWQAVKETGLVVEFIDGPDPYGNPRNAILDVTENNHLWVYPTDSGFGEALLNIGLNVNDGTTLTEAEVRAALAAEGATVLSVATHQSNTEPTLVVRVAQPLTPAQGDRLSRALRQEAVAQLANNTGDLFGPQAANWLPFNPDFFLMLDGATAAAANAMDPNPLLAVVPGETISGRPVRVNDLFRIVHDYFGHIKEGVGFRAEGEENAWRAHWAMFSPLARAALTTETRGQNSWVNFGPFGVANATADGANTQYAPQKIGLLPDWVVNEGATDERPRTDLFPEEFATAATTVPTGRVVSSKGDTAVGGNVNSEGQRITGTRQGLANFWRWFGDSEVTDDAGRPLVLYHATNGDFAEFEVGRETANNYGLLGNVGVTRSGIFMSSSPELAQDYLREGGGDNVRPIYASASQLLDLRQGLSVSDEDRLQRVGLSLSYVRNVQNYWELFDNADDGSNDFVEGLKAAGYDGAVFRETGPNGAEGTTYVVFEPAQVKSATGNRGTFDPRDRNTLKQSPVAPTVGIHFGTAPRTALSGAFYGTGLKGAEAERVADAADPRLKSRIYFYIDEGTGVRPEAGVGGYAHEAQLPPLYDAKADPLKLWKSSDLNLTEQRILDAGFSGYFIRNAFNGQGAAVVIGDAARSLPATPIANPTTSAPVAPPAPKPYRVALLSREIRALDLGKVQAVAPSAKIDAGTFSVDLAEVDAAREVAADMGVELPEAELAQGPRGSFSPAQLKINLLETADLSTFLHETGHFFLEVMADVAARPDVPARVRDDMSKLLDWFGIKGRNRLEAWRALSLDEKRPYHERFAEAFEHYLFEGKAPTTELQALFSRFRAWMINVYRSLTDFLAGHDTKLTPTVRGVFDRMLAAEEAIKATEAARAYQPIFDNAEAAGMTPEEWQAYQALGKNATDRAVGEMTKRSLRDMRLTSNVRSRELRRLQREMAERRKAVEAEVRAEVAEQPVEKARAYVKALQQEQAKADKAHTKKRDDWNARYGAAKAKVVEELKADPAFKDETPAERKLEVLRRMLRWEMENPAPAPQIDDSEMQVAADLFGFSSADELEVALRTAPPAEVTIEGMTDQRMLERYGDLTTAAGIERAADEAVHNDARARFIATGLHALMAGGREMAPTGKTVKAKGKDGKATERPQTVNVLTKAAKDFAANLAARRKVRELKPGQHVRAEARAGRLAAEAMAAGNTAAAITAQRDALLNHYAARATEDAIGEVEKAVRYLRKLADNTTMPPEYQEQIDVLLDRFDLRDTPLRTIDKRKSLAEWVEAQRAIGIEPELPAGLLDEAQRKSYKDMTLEEFRGLVTTAKQIEHLGRLKNKLLTAKDEREFEAVRDGIVASIEKHAGDRQADTRSPTTNWGRAMQAMRNFGAAHIKAATLARILDGGLDGGPMWETFVRTANERGDWETTQRAEATKALTGILGPWMKKSKTGGKGVYFPSVKRSFNRESVLAIALNTGNAGNMQRLLGGEGWTEAQLKPVLDTLTREDWQVVQAVWDYFESFRPQIAAKEKRVSGVEPEWIEATPRTVQFDDGTTLDLRGGYYPIKYDPAASVRAEEHADAEGARRQLQGAYGAATTRRSFTKTRAEEVTGRPLLYTMGGVYSGVNDVIHDLAWHEWLIDTNRLLKSEAIDGAIREHYGPAVVRQFKTWRDAVAEGEGGAQEALDAALGRLRQGVSIAGLGFNLMSALIQPLGLTQSIVRIGPAAVGRGVLQFIANPVKATRQVYEASSFMENRWRTRFRELNELRNKVQGETPVRTALNGSAYWLMMRLQQMVDVPTWLGGYEAAIAAGNDEERARALADQAVIDSQGGGMVKDLSAIERGGPAQKLFTVFYSFMNTALNLGVASKMSENVSRARFAANMLLLYTVPAVLGNALKDALTPGDAGDDDWKATVRKLLGEQLGYLMGLMVVAREFAEAAKVVTGTVDRGRDYAGPAGLRVIADTGQLAKQAAQGEFDDSFRKAFVNVMGSLFALPAAQINRTITGVQALSEGKTKNPAAIFLGYQEPK